MVLPSVNKGKHACQRVFPSLFALFALAGASLAPKERRSAASARICRLSPPASQKPKITRKSIAGRCEAVLPEQKCVQTRKDPQRILAVLSRGLTQYGHISARQNRVCPCQSMVNRKQKCRPADSGALQHALQQRRHNTRMAGAVTDGISLVVAEAAHGRSPLSFVVLCPYYNRSCGKIQYFSCFFRQ